MTIYEFWQNRVPLGHHRHSELTSIMALLKNWPRPTGAIPSRGLARGVAQVKKFNWNSIPRPLPVAFGAVIAVLWQTQILHRSSARTRSRCRSRAASSGSSATTSRHYDKRPATVIVAVGGLILGSLWATDGLVAAIFTKWGKGGLALASAFNAIPIIAIAPIP
jgi:hypothetical protein